MRAGMIFAYDNRAHRRWLSAERARSSALTGRGSGLAGADLEQVLYAMLHTNSDIVRVVVA